MQAEEHSVFCPKPADENPLFAYTCVETQRLFDSTDIPPSHIFARALFKIFAGPTSVTLVHFRAAGRKIFGSRALVR